MALTITTNYDAVEEDCLTPLIVTLHDDHRTPGCRYSIMIAFHSTKDAGGDLHRRSFLVIPDVPHQFWVKPKEKGGLTIWGFKQCPPGATTHSLVHSLDPATAELHSASIQQIVSVDPNWILVDLVMLGIRVEECNTFDAKAVGIGTATGAAGALATLVVAAKVAAGTAGGAGGGLAAIIGAAGTLSWTGVGLVILVGILIGLAVWWLLSPECCQLGVEDSDKGTQGSVFHG